jgi:LysR family transcriptional regulator for bpeEF and oprC
MTDSLSGIEAFVHTAETKSFTAAARILGISPSGVSNAVSRLEADLGVQLLNRTTRSVSLTDDGAAFFTRCQSVLSDLRDAREALMLTRVIPRGVLRASLPRALGRSVIVPRLPDFVRRYPDVVLEVDLDDRVVNVIEDGYDVVVRIVSEPKDSRLIAKQIGQTRSITCAAPAYLERFGIPERVEDLPRHNCLRFVWPQTGRTRGWLFGRDGKTVEVQPAGRIASNSNEALVAAAIAGAGIVQVYGYHVDAAFRQGDLVEILPQWSMAGAPIQALYPQVRHLSPKVRAFVDFLSQSGLAREPVSAAIT